MLHYATIPGSMDICILLTGDKDFIPACLRVRQKGVQLAVVSMRYGCNRALDTTQNMKDFDIIYLDQHLANLIVPNGNEVQQERVSAIEIIKAIYGAILGHLGEDYHKDGSRTRRVESRELGRYLKSYRVNRTNLLSEIKSVHGGLRYFVSTYPKFFTVTNSNEMAFWVEIDLSNSSIDSIEAELSRQNAITQSKTDPPDAEDLQKKTVVELKEILRANDLPVSGRKAELIDRLESYFAEETQSRSRNQSRASIDKQVIDLIKDYLQACGGSTGSRNIGRYLSANVINDIPVLAYVKENHGSLASFLVNHAYDYFKCTGIDNPELYRKDGFLITSK